jgi:hypothetical protein
MTIVYTISVSNLEILSCAMTKPKRWLEIPLWGLGGRGHLSFLDEIDSNGGHSIGGED